MKKHSDFTGGHKTESLQKSRTVPHFEYLPRERAKVYSRPDIIIFNLNTKLKTAKNMIHFVSIV